MFKREKGNYRPIEGSYASGSKYKPLQTDGYNILCPECGGYGYLAGDSSGSIYLTASLPKSLTCTFCYQGYIPLDDERVFGINFT